MKQFPTHMAINTLQRYVWLLDTLERLDHATLEQIQEEWINSSLNEFNEELPRRTFNNHKAAIGDMLGIDIGYRAGVGYYIENPQDMHESRVKEWLLSTLSTYNTLIECKDMKDRVLFESVPSSQKYLAQITGAMRSGNSISFMYQSHFSNEPHLVEVEPYCVKLFKQRWYVLAKELERNELRIYALERMSDLDETTHKFEMPKDFDCEGYFYNYYGIKAEGKSEEIKLKVIPLEAKYMRSLPIHHTQEEIETQEDYSVFSLFLSPTWDFKQDLLSRADQVEVLEPASLREWMKEMTGKMFNQYNK